MSGCQDVNGASITVTNSQLSRLVEAGESNQELQFLYEPRGGGEGHQLTTQLCRVQSGDFENAIVTPSNNDAIPDNFIVGTYENGALNWGSFNPIGRNVDFFGEEINQVTNVLGRRMLVLDRFQFSPEAADTIRGILGTEAGNDPDYRVYFDLETGALAINTRDVVISAEEMSTRINEQVRNSTQRLIQRLDETDANELPGINEEQRAYLVDVLSAEFRREYSQDPLASDFWDRLGESGLTLGTMIALGPGSITAVWVALAFGASSDDIMGIF